MERLAPFQAGFMIIIIVLALAFLLGNGSLVAFSQVAQLPNGGEDKTRGTMTTTTTTTVSIKYGCGAIDKVIHCDPILDEFESYEVPATTQRIYTVTRSDSEIPFVPGVMGGQALEFSAYFGEFLNIENTTAINSPEFSVSFWAKKDPEFSNYGHVLSHVGPGLDRGWTFDTASPETQSIRFIVFNSNGSMFSPREVELNATEFVHIVGTFDGSAVKIYRNGELNGEPVSFGGEYVADPLVPLKVALAAPQFSFPWSGTIDDIAIFNRTLSDAEVKAIYNGNAPSAVVASGLVGHWPFEGSVSDVSGSNTDFNYIIQTAGMAFAPDGRLLFNEKNTGKIRVMQNDTTVLPTPFATVPNLHYNMEQGLLGIAIDPEFEQNRYVYVYYTAKEEDGTSFSSSSAAAPFNRVARFTDLDGRGTNMTIIIDNIPAHPRGMHAGGALTFGPDGKLYVTVGDAYLPDQSQNVTSLLGKVLRINKDGSIPEDNPVPRSPVYSMGHRNMYGIAFGSQNGSSTGIISENGEELYDEINLLVKGGNYGYPSIQVPNKPPELLANDTIPPIRSYWKTIAPTQAIFYDGGKFSEELDGKFLVGSYNNGRLYALELDDDNKLHEELRIEFPYKDASNIIAVAQSPSSDIYYGGYYIYKLESVNTESKRPIVLPVELNASSTLPLNITDITFSPAEKRLVVDMSIDKAGIISPESVGFFSLSLQMPKALLDDIQSVTLDDNWENNQTRAADFNVHEIGDNGNIIEISQSVTPGSSGTMKIAIIASSTLMGS